MKQIGIVGSGAMGAGIAQVAATAGHDVIFTIIISKRLIKQKQI